MNRTLLTATLALSLNLGGVALGSSAYAQTAPVGGPDAKGNAPLKHVHTVNDGSAKPGANSFTQGQARQHMLNSGYTDVGSLAKGKDGVWRGVATHNGAQVDVAMDFKGNVTEAQPAMAGPMAPAPRATMSADVAAPAASSGMEHSSETSSTTTSAHPHRIGHHHHRRHHMRRCAHPGPNGAACSGIDRNQNGVSDKEDRAMRAGAHP